MTNTPTNPVVSIAEAANGAFFFLKTVRKHWPMVVACVLVALAIGVVYTKTQKPVYEATAMVEFNPEVVRPLGKGQDQSDGMGYWDHQEYYETEYKIITSNRVLTRVVRDLGLANAPVAKGAQAATVEDLAEGLRGQISVEPVKNSRLVLVHVTDTDAKQARRIAEAVANTYIRQNLDKSVQATGDAVVWLNGQVDQYKTALDADENALHDFKERNDLPSTSINEASNMVRLEMQQFNEALNRTKTKEQELAARNAELGKVTDSPDVLPESELLASNFLQQLRAQYQQAVKEKASLEAEGKGENHPTMMAATQRVIETKGALLHEVKNIQGAVGHDLAATQRQKVGDASLFEEARKRAVDLNMKEIEYHRLDRSRAQDEKMYGLLIERMKQADLERMMNVNNVRLVDAPTEPKAPIRPRLSTNLTFALAVGLLLGLAFAWLRDQLDSSIKTPDDVEQRLGATFLGLLPSVEDGDDGKPKPKKGRRGRTASLPLDKPELIVHLRPLSGVAEAARSIRTNLLFMNPDNPFRKLLVTSAAPSEGKTTVACSIAIALAQGGQRVCIIDCDLRRPRLHRIFDRSGDMGVTNILVGDATIDAVAKPTEVENLWSIPSGPIPPNPADVLHSERFRKFLHDLGDRFDRVVIDSPPLVPVTDGAILSTLVDGTVYVLRAFHTSRQLAQQGLRVLRDVDAPVVGAVLNAVNLNSHEYNYYYHYYYYKREGYAPRPVVPGEDDVQSESAH